MLLLLLLQPLLLPSTGLGTTRCVYEPNCLCSTGAPTPSLQATGFRTLAGDGIATNEFRSGLALNSCS